MGSTPVAYVDATGIHRPSLATILAWFTAQFQAIYGSDVSLDSSTQDGQWVGLLAAAIDDANAMAVQAYNAFSPTTAQGVGLSSVVKINGLARLVPSASTALMLIGGQAGTNIVNGLVADGLGNTWALPASVVIPKAGQIAVTAICQTAGAVAAAVGTINQIQNPQPGWQTATNTSAATAGMPVEVDAQLRNRQSLSTMNSSTAILQGVVGAVLSLPGVARARGYENTTDLPDANNIPGNCIAVIVDGGNATSIIQMIWAKKGGCGTYGSVRQLVRDSYGAQVSVAYFPVIEVTITVAVTVRQLQAFTSDVIGQIQASIAATITGLGIGNSIQWNRLYAAAYLSGGANGNTFEVESLAVARGGVTPTPADVAIAFNEAALCVAANVTVTVSPT